jgi:hypothetical protein
VHKCVEDLSKDAAQPPALVWISGAVELWITAAAGALPGSRAFPAATLYRAGQPLAGWPVERPPPLLEASMPGVFAAGNVRHRPVKRVASATGKGATAIQLPHQYLQALDSGRHPGVGDKLNRGLPAVVLHACQAPGLRRQGPGTVLGTEFGFWRRTWHESRHAGAGRPRRPTRQRA